MLVLMGSGETSPTMVSDHARILAAHPGEAFTLETTYGFQENADELTRRVQHYFAQSVGREVAALPLRSSQDSPLVIAETIAALARTQWVFAGPGSPTYALDVWRDTGADVALQRVLQRGTLVFASAAALTAGSHTVPVYEIYKVGQAPVWREGLDLLGAHTGLRAAVVPHYDNTDGGTHDTRCCYIGERRMQQLEQQLPEDVFILGIDEHTGVQFDLDTRTALVFGRGVMTIRMEGRAWQVPSGTTINFDEIAHHAGTRLHEVETAAPQGFDATVLHALIDEGLVLEAVDALLAMDDVEQEPATRAAMRSVVLRLGQLAANPTVDPESIIAPYIEALLEARNHAREHREWHQADAIRDRLTELRVSVKDGPEGSTWSIGNSQQM